MHTEKLGPTPIFRIPQTDHQLLVLKPFVDAVQQHHLTGFMYKLVWPHSEAPPVVMIAVKKLPRATSDDPPAPELSTKADVIGTEFVDELLGSPLTRGSQTRVEIVAYRLPDLSLPTGKLVAADLLLSEGRPFVQRIKPGKYPITLIADRIESGDERIALAMIQFSDSPVVRWEIAEVEKSGKKRQDELAGYGVDSGTGGFCDAAAQEELSSFSDPERTLMTRIEEAMEKSYRNTRSWIHVETAGGSAAIFSSGWGDGCYRSYLGFDHAGNPVTAMTDFGIVDWPRRPESR
jgi:hypothetical protein